MLTWSTTVDQSKHVARKKVNKVSNAADLSRALRRALGDKTQGELAAVLLVSRNYISQIEAGLKTPSERLEAEMRRLLTESTEAPKVSMAEETVEGITTQKNLYAAGETSRHGMGVSHHKGVSKERMTIEPRFSVPARDPNEEDCRRYFEEFLSLAKNHPGGIAWTWRELKKNFPLDEFDPKPK